MGLWIVLVVYYFLGWTFAALIVLCDCVSLRNFTKSRFLELVLLNRRNLV